MGGKGSSLFDKTNSRRETFIHEIQVKFLKRVCPWVKKLFVESLNLYSDPELMEGAL